MSSATTARTNNLRYVIVAGLVVAAFFGAYRFAGAKDAAPTGTPTDTFAQAGAPAGAPADGSVPGCACCGSTAPTEGGITGDPVEGVATEKDGVQAIEVDLSAGYYQPNVIRLAAGVPANITFGQGSGCLAQVMSEELRFFEDLTAGPVTVELPALEPGEYPFSCGMAMVFGKIVVE